MQSGTLQGTLVSYIFSVYPYRPSVHLRLAVCMALEKHLCSVLVVQQTQCHPKYLGHREAF